MWRKSCVLIGYLILPAWDCPLCSRAWKMLHGADSQWCNFWTMLAMELQKAVEGNQNKNINNSPGFIVLQTQLPSFVALQLNKSFLILDKEKSFCFKIYLLLTKLVWLWLLNISLILFCVFFKNLNFVSVLKKLQKRTWPISRHLDLTFG